MTIARHDLAARVGISTKWLGVRLRWLEAFGYLKREVQRDTRRFPVDAYHSPYGYLPSQFQIIKMPTKDDQHDVGAAERATEPGPAGQRPRSPEPRRGSRAKVDPEEVVRLYDGEIPHVWRSRLVKRRLGVRKAPDLSRVTTGWK